MPEQTAANVEKAPLSSSMSIASDEGIALNGNTDAGAMAKAERPSRVAFLVMTIPFSICHATVTVPVGYASAVLQSEIGNASNGVLYGVTVISAFLLAPLTNGVIGPKWGLVISMIAYTIYVIMFAAASLLCQQQKIDPKTGLETSGCQVGGDTQWTLALVGACIGGLGAGVLWTCQGAFFAEIVDRVAEVKLQVLGSTSEESKKKVKEDASSDLAAEFAWYYLGIECLAKMFFTIMQKYIEVKSSTAFFIYAGLSAVSTIAFCFSQDLRSRAPPGPRPSLFAKSTLAVELWVDPKIWLLMFTNLTFGFSVAWLNGYVNGTYLEKAVSSTDFIGFLGALIAFIAAVSSRVFGCINKSTGKLPIVVLGAVCFLLVGVLSKITAPNGEGPGGWGWGIIVFYFLQGFGRGVYESTNKGIFADFFPGKGPGAFANVMMQGTLSGAIAFALVAAKLQEPVLWLLLIFAVLTVPGLLAATALQNRASSPEMRQPVLVA